MRHLRSPLIPVLFIGLLLPSLRAQAQQAPPDHRTKIAIVCAQAGGQPADQIAALLDAALTGSKTFALVERQALRELIHEQELQTLSDSASAAKFGRLAGADLLLFCQAVDGSKPPLIRLRLVETADGVILLDDLQELQTLAADPAPFRDALADAVRKAAIPLADRRVIGVVDVASEEPGKSLDPLATTLGVVLRVDLAQSPSVVVLEREQLRHLIAERGLSGMDVKLRAATRLLEVKISRNQAGSDKLQVSATLRDMAAGESRTLTLAEPRQDMPALRRALLREILQALAAPLPDHAPGDLQAEARAFHERAQMLLLHGYLKEALPLAETAYTLDPQILYFRTIARCCQDIFYHVNPLLGGDSAYGQSHVGNLEELGAALLLAQMHLDASAHIATAIPPDLSDPRDLHWGPLFTDFDCLRPMFPLPDPPVTPEQKILQRLLELAEQELRFWSDLDRAHHWSSDTLAYATILMGPYLAHDGPDYCRRAKAAYEDFQGEQAVWLKTQTGRPPLYPDICILCNYFHYVDRLGNVTAKDLRPLLTWLTKQPDPLLRIQGWNGFALLQADQGDDDAALKAADALFRAKPLFAAPQSMFCEESDSELFREKYFGDFIPRDFLPGDYIYRSIYTLYSDKRLPAYTAGLLDELEKRGDPLPLVRWTRQTCELLRLDPRADLAMSLRMQKLLESHPVPPEFAQNLGILQKNLTDRILICRQRLGLVPDKSNRWDSVSVRQIKYQSAPAGAPHLIWLSVDRSATVPDLLMLWRSDPVNEHDGQADFTLVLGRLSLDGGPINELARGTFPGPVYDTYGTLRGFRITTVLPTPQGIFIADFRRGLLVAKGGKITSWTEKDGLASDQIWSLAWTRNTLFAGADNGFMTIDPVSAKCRILCSGKALTSTSNPFNGGTPYRFANILPAPDGKTLWIAVGGDFNRMGLWRYDMDTATFEQIVRVSDHDPELPVGLSTGPSLTWHDGSLLVIMAPAGICLQTPMGLLDARTGHWLKTYYGERADIAGIRDSFPDERNADKVYKPIAYTPQHRAALTSIGLIKQNGDAVDPARDKGYYYNWHLEEPLAGSADSVYLAQSRIATPELCRPWKTIEEVGAGFVAASYEDGQGAPVIWYLTSPELPLPPVAEFERH